VRVSLRLSLSWDSALAATSSRQARDLSRRITEAIDSLYADIPGRQTSSVVAFR
jgi:hypothetical protein